MSRVEKIGLATLYLGDARDVLPGIEAVDAVVTDPPYGVGFKYASHDDKPEAYAGGYGAWLWSIIEAAEAKCSPGSPVFVWQASLNVRRFAEWFPRDWRLFVAAKNFAQMRPTAMQYAYDPVIVWWTEGEPWSEPSGEHGVNRDFHVANVSATISKGRTHAHPCPRPLDQVQHIIRQWVRPNGVTLDCFMGSGTAGVAAIAAGRRFVGIEKDPEYFEIACRRIAAASGSFAGHDGLFRDAAA